MTAAKEYRQTCKNQKCRLASKAKHNHGCLTCLTRVYCRDRSDMNDLATASASARLASEKASAHASCVRCSSEIVEGLHSSAKAAAAAAGKVLWPSDIPLADRTLLQVLEVAMPHQW